MYHQIAYIGDVLISIEFLSSCFLVTLSLFYFLMLTVDAEISLWMIHTVWGRSTRIIAVRGQGIIPLCNSVSILLVVATSLLAHQSDAVFLVSEPFFGPFGGSSCFR